MNTVAAALVGYLTFPVFKITTFKILFCWYSGLNLEFANEAEFCGP